MVMVTGMDYIRAERHVNALSAPPMYLTGVSSRVSNAAHLRRPSNRAG